MKKIIHDFSVWLKKIIFSYDCIHFVHNLIQNYVSTNYNIRVVSKVLSLIKKTFFYNIFLSFFKQAPVNLIYFGQQYSNLFKPSLLNIFSNFPKYMSQHDILNILSYILYQDVSSDSETTKQIHVYGWNTTIHVYGSNS